MYVYLAAAAVVGACAVIYSIPAAIYALWKRFWVVTDGVIITAEFKRSRDSDNRLATHFCVKYIYRVDGVDYVGADSIKADVPYYEERETREMLTREYAPGHEIEVYYPSGLPQISAARRNDGDFRKAVFVGTVGTFLMIVAYYAWLAMSDPIR